MSSIDKPPGFKYYRYRFSYVVDGKRKHKTISLRVTNLAAAKRLQVKFDEEVANNNFGFLDDLSPINLSELVSAYLNYINKRKKRYAAGTLDRYKYSAKVMLEVCGDIPLENLTPGLVKTKILPTLEERFESQYTVKHHMVNFRTVMSFAVDSEFIARNPFRKLVPRVNTKIPVYFKEDEIEVYKRYWSDENRPPWQQTYFLLLLHTGMRLNECLNLLWSKHVDIDNNMLMPLGKGNKERVIPLSDQAIEVLKSSDKKDGEDRVFWQVKNEYAVKTAFRMFRKRTGWTYRLHDSRSNWASYYAMRVGNLAKLRRILGHKNQATTDKYSVFIPDYVMEERNVNTF